VTPGIALDDEGSGEPLVLMHGLATTRTIWRRAIPLLRGERRLVSLDVPGFGASPPVGPGFDLDEVAARVADGVEAAGVPAPYDLVGHSLGGALAVTLAAHRPGRVGRLVLVAPAGLRPMPARAARAFGAVAARAIPLRGRGEALADLAWGRRLLLWPGTAEPAALMPGEARALLTASRGATRISEALAAAASADIRPLLRRVDAPVAAIWGERDRIVPLGGLDTLLAVRPDATAARVPRAGHIPMIEQPQAFVDALEEVLAAGSPPGNKKRRAAL
jgi:pimeloyl-ACP methyl ester carboxylesterase